MTELLTLRIGVALDWDEDAVTVGPRIVHEVDARTLFDHVRAVLDRLPEHDLDALDVPPRFELTLWRETERRRWPVDVLAIERDLADVLLDGRLDHHLGQAGLSTRMVA